MQESPDGESEAAELVNEEADDYVEDTALGSWLRKRGVEVLDGVAVGRNYDQADDSIKHDWYEKIIELCEFFSVYSSAT